MTVPSDSAYNLYCHDRNFPVAVFELYNTHNLNVSISAVVCASDTRSLYQNMLCIGLMSNLRPTKFAGFIAI